MLQDYKLGLRMLLKYPGLTLAGGLALAVAIGVGAGWYDLSGTLFSPAIPLPDGDRIVQISTQNVLTNTPESRVAHDFLEWRRELRTIQELGAFRLVWEQGWHPGGVKYPVFPTLGNHDVSDAGTGGADGSGDAAAASHAYQLAIGLETDPSVRRFLEARLHNLGA